MSFEKKMKKRGNDKLNQFAKNPYHKEEAPVVEKPKKSFPTWGKILIPTAAVATALVLFVTVGILPNIAGGNMAAIKQGGGEGNFQKPEQEGSNKDAGKTNPGSQAGHYSNPDPQYSTDETASMKNWDERSIIEKYPDFVYGDKEYQIRYVDRSEPIAASNINLKLADIIVRGSYTSDAQVHYINASIYSIKSISDQVSLAILFEGETAYYAYQNTFYKPQTLSDLLADTCFEDEAVISSASYINYIRSDYNKSYTSINNATIKDILYSDKSPANLNIRAALKADTSSQETSQMAGSNERIDLTIGFTCLGIDNASITIFSNGRMDANFFGTVATFDIGVSRYNAIKDSLDSNN